MRAIEACIDAAAEIVAAKKDVDGRWAADNYYESESALADLGEAAIVLADDLLRASRGDEPSGHWPDALARVRALRNTAPRAGSLTP